MSVPNRIQRQRTKGWRMPEGAIYVGRPSRWGNPFSVFKQSRRDGGALGSCWQVRDLRFRLLGRFKRQDDAIELAITRFEALARHGIDNDGSYPTWDIVRAELAGHDLVCWCPLDRPCHADVLLRIANAAR